MGRDGRGEETIKLAILNVGINLMVVQQLISILLG